MVENSREELFTAILPYFVANAYISCLIFLHFSAGYSDNHFFPDNMHCIFGLPVPDILKHLKHCDQHCQKRELEALLKLYKSTGGKYWFNRHSNNWGHKNVSHCEWEGIVCYGNTSHVIAVDLYRQNLTGYIDNALGDLSFLLGLCFGQNYIQGSLRKTLKPISRHLIRMDLQYNLISGHFPGDVITEFSILHKIQLSGNINLNGTLPENIGDLKLLGELSIGETRISGTIPESVGQLTELWFLDFETLQMRGNLSLFKPLIKLRLLHLSSNKITGPIPRNIGEWYPEMQELLLQNNNLHGNIPESIGLMTNLTYLNLARNQKLTGLLPKSIGRLTKLKILIISETDLRGFQKGFHFNTSELTFFSAYRNHKFSFNINYLTKNLQSLQHSLQQIDLGGCSIHGEMTGNIFFVFRNLHSLNLGKNKISGLLPDPKYNVPLLTNLNLSNNNFSGDIPTSYTQLLMLRELDLQGNPGMHGEVDPSYLETDYSVMSKEKPSDHYSCPLLRFKHNNGIVRVDSGFYQRKYCYCDVGYYGIGGFCQHCLANAQCPGESRKNTTLFKHEAILTHMRISKGAWPFPSPKNVKRFVLCPFLLRHGNICNPERNCVCQLRKHSTKNSMQFITECNKSCLCAKGHLGRFCSQCKPNYYRASVNCIKCPTGLEKDHQIVSLSCFTIAIIITTGLAVWLSGNKKKLALLLIIAESITMLVLALRKIVSIWVVQVTILLGMYAYGGYGHACKGLFKTGVFYFQVIDVLVSSVNIWPESVYKVQTFSSTVLNLQFDSISCYMPVLFQETARFISLLFLLPAIVIATWMIYGLWYFIHGKKNPNHANELNLKSKHYCLVFCDLVYFPIVKAVFSITVPCQTEVGQSFMRNYVWIECGSTKHKVLTIMAAIAIPVYVLGIPLCLYVSLLYYNRKKIRNNDATTTSWLGSIYLPYKEKYRSYMEVLLTMRRMIVAMLLSVIPTEMPLQTFLITIVFIIAIVHIALAKPYAVYTNHNAAKNELGLENSIEIAMLSVLLGSFVAVRFFIGKGTITSSVSILWMVIVANLLLFAALGISILKRMVCSGNVEAEEEGEPKEPEEPLLSCSEGLQPEE